MLRPTCVLLAATAVLCPAFAQTDPNQAVTPLYSKLAQAMRKRDADGMAKLVRSVATPDFTYISKVGKKFNLTEMLKNSGAQMRFIKEVTSASAKPERGFVNGKTAQFQVTTKYAVKFADPKGKMHSSALTGVSLDTWQWNGKAWKLRATRALSDKLTLDGKPFNPK